MLAQDGFFSQARANTPDVGGRCCRPRPSHFAPKAKSCIFLFMYGGPSHMDLFDPKPELTKRDGQPMPNLENDPRFDAGRTQGKPLLGSLWEFKKHGAVGHRSVDACFPTWPSASTTWRSFARAMPTALPTARACCR